MIIRLVTVLSVTAIVLALPTGAAAQAPSQDLAVGDVCLGYPACATFDARSGPRGETPSGSVHVSTSEEIAGGPVTCLTVTGSRATVGFADTLRPGDGSDGGFLNIEDNGSPGVGRDNIIFGLTREAPTVCPPNVLVYDPLRRDRVFEGDLTVRDAQPLPTSEAQCTRGGWAQFGFKNQRQCIRLARLIPGPGAYPFSRAECRHGGWDLFGFRNERTCLRFVRLMPNP
jgi:hypothetical protein